MEHEENPICGIHKAENDLYCLTCNKAICLYCKCVHPKDHMQIIHLAELSANMIIQVKTRLETLKGALGREDDEIASMTREFEEDKKYLYAMIKRVERMVVQMLHSATAGLTKTLQKNDEELRLLRTRIEDKKIECDQSEKLLKQLMDFNSKKDYWQIYLIQDKLKKGNKMQYNTLFSADLKKDAIKEAVSRGQQPKTKEVAAPLIAIEITAKKEELKKCIAVTDYSYLNDVGKEITKALNLIQKRLLNDISSLKLAQNVIFIKNSPDTLIKKQDKVWLANWLLNGRNSGKVTELELLYKATRDGFGAAEFHANCDNKAPTLTLISAEGEIFGGYTSQPWTGQSPGIFKEDSTAFTFSLNKKVKCPVNTAKKQMAVRHLDCAGPVFGGTEIHVSNNANSNTESHAVGGITYVIPSDCDPKTFYAGKECFQISEIEVYRVKLP